MRRTSVNIQLKLVKRGSRCDNNKIKVYSKYWHGIYIEILTYIHTYLCIIALAQMHAFLWHHENIFTYIYFVCDSLFRFENNEYWKGSNKTNTLCNFAAYAILMHVCTFRHQKCTEPTNVQIFIHPLKYLQSACLLVCVQHVNILFIHFFSCVYSFQPHPFYIYIYGTIENHVNKLNFITKIELWTFEYNMLSFFSVRSTFSCNFKYDL